MLFYFCHRLFSVLILQVYSMMARNWEISVRSHSLLHPWCCYLYLPPPLLAAEQSWAAYGIHITEGAPCCQAREAVGSSQATSS